MTMFSLGKDVIKFFKGFGAKEFINSYHLLIHKLTIRAAKFVGNKTGRNYQAYTLYPICKIKNSQLFGKITKS